VVIVPFFQDHVSDADGRRGLFAETKHTWIVPLRASNRAGLYRGLAIRHKESQVTREDGDVIGRNIIGRLGQLVGCFHVAVTSS
jgi:hypothetical protein